MPLTKYWRVASLGMVGRRAGLRAVCLHSARLQATGVSCVCGCAGRLCLLLWPMFVLRAAPALSACRTDAKNRVGAQEALFMPRRVAIHHSQVNDPICSLHLRSTQHDRAKRVHLVMSKPLASPSPLHGLHAKLVTECCPPTGSARSLGNCSALGEHGRRCPSKMLLLVQLASFRLALLKFFERNGGTNTFFLRPLDDIHHELPVTGKPLHSNWLDTDLQGSG